jgi:glycosyltransferase involved in cell wall biosynthesis
MTRVLHLIPNMGGGGAERELAHLAGELHRQGLNVHVGLIGEGPNYERLARSGAVIHKIRVFGNHDPRLLLRIHRLMREVRPNLVQTWLTQMDVAGGAVARWRRIPWILSERASTTFYVPTIKNRLHVWVARSAALIQANSEAGARYWAGVLPKVRSMVIRNPVPVAEIEAVAAADLSWTGRRDGVPLLLFAGRFEEQKNVHTMLRAFAEVLRVRPAVAAVCGQGPLAKDVRKWLAELGIADRVALPGYVTEIWSWMKAADVFVSVSHYEGQPNTVVEAAAARCPLVVSGIPEHREFLRDGVHALLRDGRDPLAIAAAIHEVLDDPDAARRRAGAAYRVVADWTVDAIAAVHVAMYDDLLRLRPSRSTVTALRG